MSSHEQRGGRIEEVEQRWWILRVPDADEPGTRSVQTLRLSPDAHVGRTRPIRIAPGGARPNGRQTRLGGRVHRRKLEQPPRRQRGQTKKDEERCSVIGRVDESVWPGEVRETVRPGAPGRASVACQVTWPSKRHGPVPYPTAAS